MAEEILVTTWEEVDRAAEAMGWDEFFARIGRKAMPKEVEFQLITVDGTVSKGEYRPADFDGVVIADPDNFRKMGLDNWLYLAIFGPDPDPDLHDEFWPDGILCSDEEEPPFTRDNFTKFIQALLPKPVAVSKVGGYCRSTTRPITGRDQPFRRSSPTGREGARG